MTHNGALGTVIYPVVGHDTCDLEIRPRPRHRPAWWRWRSPTGGRRPASTARARRRRGRPCRDAAAAPDRRPAPPGARAPPRESWRAGRSSVDERRVDDGIGHDREAERGRFEEPQIALGGEEGATARRGERHVEGRHRGRVGVERGERHRAGALGPEALGQFAAVRLPDRPEAGVRMRLEHRRDRREPRAQRALVAGPAGPADRDGVALRQRIWVTREVDAVLHTKRRSCRSARRSESARVEQISPSQARIAASWARRRCGGNSRANSWPGSAATPRRSSSISYRTVTPAAWSSAIRRFHFAPCTSCRTTTS